jgi:hypothetical protein
MEGLKTGCISKSETTWLDSLNVPLRQFKVDLDGKSFLVDGYNPANNTVYEYYGAYWHGNPKNFTPDDINQTLKVSFGYLYRKTLERERLLLTKYNIITLWEDCGKKPK